MNYLYLIIVFLLSSCTVGPTYHRPVAAVPSHYSEAKKGDFKKRHFGYASFNDPILNDLIRRALRGDNMDIQKALANFRQARAELGIARADLFPKLDVNGYIHRDRLSANSEILVAFPPNVVPLSYTDYKPEFDASWEIDVFGHTRRGIEAATARFQSALETQHNVAIVVAAETARVYTQYRIYQQRIRASKQTIDYYGETVKLINLQLRAGSASNVDLQRAESEWLAAKAALPPLQAEAKANLASLAILVGEYPETLLNQIDKIAPIPVVKPSTLDIGLPSELLQRRPDIRIAERQLAAATADVGVAVADQFPRFQLIADLGSDTTKAGTYWQKASIFWSVGPQISIPIFHGKQLRNRVKAQEAARDAALVSYKQTILQAFADVESSLIRFHREEVKKRNLFYSYNKLKSMNRLIKLQYQSGRASLLDVLDVERQLNSIHDQYIQSLGQTTINLISLQKALGGDW